jgi:hypothetical protein
MTHHAGICHPQASSAGREQGATASPGHIVRRVLLRRGCCTEAETVRLVADAVLASADQVVLRVLRQGFCTEAAEALLVVDAIMTAYLASPAAGSPQPDPGGR